MRFQSILLILLGLSAGTAVAKKPARPAPPAPKVYIGRVSATKEDITWTVTAKVRNATPDTLDVKRAVLAMDDGTFLELLGYDPDSGNQARYTVQPGAVGSMTFRGDERHADATHEASAFRLYYNDTAASVWMPGFPRSEAPTSAPGSSSGSSSSSTAGASDDTGSALPKGPYYPTPLPRSLGPCGLQKAEVSRVLDEWFVDLKVRYCGTKPLEINWVELKCDDASTVMLMCFDGERQVKIGDTVTTEPRYVGSPIILKPNHQYELSFRGTSLTHDEGTRKPVKVKITTSEGNTEIATSL